MKGILTHFKKLDWILIIATLLLVAIGFLSIYSSSLSKGNFLNFQKQIIFLIVGFCLMMILSFFDWRILRNDPYLIMVLYFSFLLVLACLFFFAPEIRGVKSWYKIGPFLIDPIEPVKLILIILLAKYFSMRHIEMYKISHIIFSGIYILIPAFLIFFQPNLGPILILISLWLGILIISGIKTRHLLILCLCGFLIFIFSWTFLLKDYHKDRIISFINPKIDPQGISWNINQSKIAIGSGGIFGKGIGRGSQVQYGFLPFPQTDFIFAAIAEETGLFGIGTLMTLFAFLIWRIFKIAFSAESNFPRLFAVGLAILFICQAFIHIGMNLGLLPIIGLSLPLVSYGGSGLIASYIGLGILQSIKTH